MDAAEYLAGEDPALAEACEAVLGQFPQSDRAEFGIIAFITTLAAIIDIIQYCKSIHSGVSLARVARTAGVLDRLALRRSIRRAIEAKGELHPSWDRVRQVLELSRAMIEAARLADVAKLDAVVRAAKAAE